jgi:hypothetical protein
LLLKKDLQQNELYNMNTYVKMWLCHPLMHGEATLNIVVFRAVAVQRPWDSWIYQGRFWAVTQQTRSHSNGCKCNNRRAVLSVWSGLRCHKQRTR